MNYCVYFLAFAVINLYSLKCIDGAQILTVFPIAEKNINKLYQRLIKGLADAGHQVTSISAYEYDLSLVNGSVRDVILTGFEDKFKNIATELKGHEYTGWFGRDQYMNLVIDVYNQTLYHPHVKKFLTWGLKFDAVIIEDFWSESLLGFASFFDCPSIVFSRDGLAFSFVTDLIRNPFLLGNHSNCLNFFGRTCNFLSYLYDIIFQKFYYFPVHNQLLKSAFPNISPDASSLYHNISLVLLNSHSSLRPSIPLLPNVIEIGGFHLNPPKKLPKDLQDYLDSAQNGAIYIHLGQNIQNNYLSDEKKQTLLNVFKKLNVKVIWKYEGKVLPEKPNNVLVKKWLTQMDVLAHPKITLFITNGDFDSSLEAMYNGVPTLMLPLFAEQIKNSYDAQQEGYALKLPLNDKNFNENPLYDAIKEILDNPKYAETAKTRSKIYHDRPMKPLDTAVYWIEYIIRHKGANHLKVEGVNLPLFKLYMWDVILFLVLLITLILITIYITFKKQKILKKSNQKLKKQN